MTEAKAKKVKKGPIRVNDMMLAALKNEQHRIWEETGREPSYGELIEKAWKIYWDIAAEVAESGPPAPGKPPIAPPPPPAAHLKAYRLLDRLLAAHPARWVEHMLNALAEAPGDDHGSGTGKAAGLGSGTPQPAAPIRAANKNPPAHPAHGKGAAKDG